MLALFVLLILKLSKNTVIVVITFYLGVLVSLNSANANLCKDYLILTSAQTSSSSSQIVKSVDELVGANDIKYNSWAADYVTMALQNHLISQSDLRLYEMNLIIEGGGLCGPTCVTNIAISRDFHISEGKSTYWSRHAPTFINGLINSYRRAILKFKELAGENALLGTYLEFFTGEFNSDIPDLGVYARSIPVDSPNMMNHHLKNKNGILLALVEFIDPLSPFYNSGHAIVILGMNKETKHLIVSDPNNPDIVLRTPYKIIQSTLEFNLQDEEYHQTGTGARVRLVEVYSYTIR